jgi:hypothetical protein
LNNLIKENIQKKKYKNFKKNKLNDNQIKNKRGKNTTENKVSDLNEWINNRAEKYLLKIIEDWLSDI